MESTRWLAALFFLIIMFAGIYVYSKNSKAIVTLGIPLSLVVFVGIIYWVKAMGDKADAYSKRALDARRGAVAKEDVGNLLGKHPPDILKRIPNRLTASEAEKIFVILGLTQS